MFNLSTVTSGSHRKDFKKSRYVFLIYHNFTLQGFQEIKTKNNKKKLLILFNNIQFVDYHTLNNCTILYENKIFNIVNTLLGCLNFFK